MADEHMCSEWARQRARLKRCEEEVELFVVEMECVLGWFDARAWWWEQQASLRGDVDAQLAAGLIAYAHHQASQLRALGRVCMTYWKPVLSPAHLAGGWINTWPTNKVDVAHGDGDGGGYSGACIALPFWPR